MQQLSSQRTLSQIEGHTFDPSLLDRNSIVLDIGGNRGRFASEIMHYYGCYIESFEPDLTAFMATSLNLLSDRVIIHQRAVAGRSGVRTFYCAEPLSGGNSIISGHSEFQSCADRARTYPIYAVSMESILSRLPKVDLIKFDCEGAEFEIFEQTPPNLWAKVKQITIEFHEFCFDNFTSFDIEKVSNLLQGLGFAKIVGEKTDSLFIRAD